MPNVRGVSGAEVGALHRKTSWRFAGWWRWLTGNYGPCVAGDDLCRHRDAVALLAEEPKNDKRQRRY